MTMRDMQVDTRHIYYGWYVCAAAMLIGFVATGARQSFGVFVVPMSDEFGWTRFEVSMAASLGVLVNGVSQPFIGRIFDQTGGRKLVLAAVIVLSASTMMLALTFHILFLAFMFGSSLYYIKNSETLHPPCFKELKIGLKR